MADHLHQPHDHLVRTVLRDVAQAPSFLHRDLPEPVCDPLQGDTLRLLEGSFRTGRGGGGRARVALSGC